MLVRQMSENSGESENARVAREKKVGRRGQVGLGSGWVTPLFVKKPKVPGAPKPMKNKGFHLQKTWFLATKNKVFDGFGCW